MNHDQAPVAVVTGAASGIGRAIALKLAAEGYDVLVHTGRNLRGLQETCSDIRDFGVQSRAITADYRQSHSLRTLVDSAFNWQGRVDAWINNAGADVLTGQGRQLSFQERLNELWQVDVVGTMIISRLVAERWRACEHLHQGTSRPSIVNTGWDQATRGMEGDSGQLFCTTKPPSWPSPTAWLNRSAPWPAPIAWRRVGFVPLGYRHQRLLG